MRGRERDKANVDFLNFYLVTAPKKKKEIEILVFTRQVCCKNKARSNHVNFKF